MTEKAFPAGLNKVLQIQDKQNTDIQHIAHTDK